MVLKEYKMTTQQLDTIIEILTEVNKILEDWNNKEKTTNEW